jgi:hypothetical protein
VAARDRRDTDSDDITLGPDWFRDLSSSIALKRDFLTVFLTVNPAALVDKLISFRFLQVPETFEWE